MTGLPDPTDVNTVRTLLAEEDRRLLGATIALADADWQAPSLLPGWGRGHLATHLARNADALRRLARGARTGTDEEMYPDSRDEEIEAGAYRTGVDLQTDLDRTTERLQDEFGRVAEADAWPTSVTLRGGARTAAANLPAARLTEVVLHHVDLDIGYRVDDIDTATALTCLASCADRFGRRPDFPALRLITADVELTVGDISSTSTTVVGPAPRILGWLTGRSTSDGLDGATAQLPDFG